MIDQGDGSISANGLNNRYNNISVDGVTQGDPFGLNANGLPYQKRADLAGHDRRVQHLHRQLST